jgi:hypothetical protein
MTLKNDKGQPLQCDVENGGKDRKAYMIVTTSHLERAKFELERYKANLRPDPTHPTAHITAFPTIPVPVQLKSIFLLRQY